MQELSPVQWAIRPLKKYAVFSGRASRAEYWWFYLATLVGSFLTGLADKAVGETEAISTIFSLGILVPTIAVAVRRLHDTNRSGKWLLILAIPFALAIVAVVIGVGTGSTPGGPSALLVTAGLGIIAAGITLLVFLVLPGTDGSNDYGSDPYGPGQLEEVFA